MIDDDVDQFATPVGAGSPHKVFGFVETLEIFDEEEISGRGLYPRKIHGQEAQYETNLILSPRPPGVVSECGSAWAFEAIEHESGPNSPPLVPLPLDFTFCLHGFIFSK
jgi:hypothetical protein